MINIFATTGTNVSIIFIRSEDLIPYRSVAYIKDIKSESNHIKRTTTPARPKVWQELLIDKTNTSGKTVLVDASNLGTKIKDGKNQKTLLSKDEEQRIIDAVNNQISEDGFSVVKTFDEIKEGKYSFNPGGYFDVTIEHIDITPEEFAANTSY